VRKLIPGSGARQGDTRHAGAICCFDSGGRIFNNDALLRRDVQALPRDLKDLRVGFAASHVNASH
jgi:hypothetical protein